MPDWFQSNSVPAQGAAGTSSVIRSEFSSIETEISDKLPTFTGNGDDIIAVNAGGTALTNVTRAALATSLAASSRLVDDTTNTGVTLVATYTHTVSNSPGIGIGTGIAFETETTAGNHVGGIIESVATAVTSGSENFDLILKTMVAGAVATELARLKSNGEFNLPTGGAFAINDVPILNATTLNASVTSAAGLTTVGNIGTGTWQGGIIAEAYLENQSGTNTGDEDLASINALGITTVAEAAVTAHEAALTITVGQLTGVTASATEINYTDVTALGTVQASKAVTAGSSKEIDFDSGVLTNVNIDGGSVDGATVGAASHNTGKFTTLQATGATTFGAEIVEETGTLTPVTSTITLDPAGGTVQALLLTQSITTVTDNLADGEFLTLHITGAYTITWTGVPVLWIGGAAPVIDGTDPCWVELWKVGSTLYGSYIGDAT